MFGFARTPPRLGRDEYRRICGAAMDAAEAEIAVAAGAAVDDATADAFRRAVAVALSALCNQLNRSGRPDLAAAEAEVGRDALAAACLDAAGTARAAALVAFAAGLGDRDFRARVAAVPKSGLRAAAAEYAAAVAALVRDGRYGDPAAARGDVLARFGGDALVAADLARALPRPPGLLARLFGRRAPAAPPSALAADRLRGALAAPGAAPGAERSRGEPAPAAPAGHRRRYPDVAAMARVELGRARGEVEALRAAAPAPVAAPGEERLAARLARRGLSGPALRVALDAAAEVRAAVADGRAADFGGIERALVAAGLGALSPCAARAWSVAALPDLVADEEFAAAFGAAPRRVRQDTAASWAALAAEWAGARTEASKAWVDAMSGGDRSLAKALAAAMRRRAEAADFEARVEARAREIADERVSAMMRQAAAPAPAADPAPRAAVAPVARRRVGAPRIAAARPGLDGIGDAVGRA